MKKTFLIICLLFSYFNMNAQSENAANSDAIHKDPHSYNNHIALFLGSTSYYNERESYFSIGLDYLYRPNNKRPWAYSAMAEVIFAEHTEFVVAFPIYHYIKGEWWFRTGPGMEIIQKEEHHGDEAETKSHVEFLFRVGTGYSFHVGRIVLSPSIDIDFVRNQESLVWGLNIGYSF